MTAEIGVLNKSGVALAADSAVTIGNGRKIYNSANKLFALSKFHPVGIMIYGTADFMGVPWETIIKVYRHKLSDKHYSNLERYATDFVDFLTNNPFKELSSTSEQDSYLQFLFDVKIESIRDRIINLAKEIVNGNEEITPDDLEKYFSVITEEEIIEEFEYYNQLEYIQEFSDDDFNILVQNYSQTIYQLIEEKFENIPVDQSLFEKILGICIYYVLKEFTSDQTGLVIAGFGEDEIYPTLISYVIEGKINNKLKVEISNKAEIGESGSAAAIIPFAQSDMVHTFISGIDPDIERLSNEYLGNIFKSLPQELLNFIKENTTLENENYNELVESFEEVSNNLFEEYRNAIDNYRNEHYINPIIGIVRNLPKDELAEMAEALVNLTSFKRRVSSSLETVGGPVDVAVITKGDGFIWIKRKHYFSSELNQQFFQKYLRGERHVATHIEE
ncbi:hypothetical protein DZB84_14795 [Bacillus sp. HNG]|uniref:hypothetical protein n=1 Tax=Bacillus sp. HNG TaxID=2293325 RepID=UPI000E2E63D6|nr:hypothetical protein [Bacillus sp. HNG]RFB14711.1 hypothetical protein DZB84_14795 [Bacillus sp. HNG]